MRIAGIELSALTRLRCDKSYAALQAHLAERECLTRDGAELSDALFPVIGELSDGSMKPALVGLRRAVFQLRVPSRREWNEHVARALPGTLRQHVEAWVTRLREHQSSLAELADVVETEAAAKRAELRAVTDDAHFLRALSLSSPTLFQVLRKWHADARHQPKRQSLSRLAKYLARAAVKTSPYSTFTVSGLGRWTDSTETRLLEPDSTHCVLELSRLTFDRVRDALAADPRLLPALPVRVNPSTTRSAGTLRFTAPSPDEPIVSIPESPAVAEVLRVLDDGEARTAGQLRARLAAAHGDDEAIGRFVDKLRTAGLLEAQLPMDDQAERPYAELADWLDTHAPPEFAACREPAANIDLELHRAIEPGDLDGHRTRERALQAHVSALTGAVRELTGTDTAAAAPGTDSVVLHDNAVFGGLAVECALPEWQPALDDLDIVRRWLAIHDPVLPLRLVLGAFFEQRFGPDATVPWLDLHRAVHEEIEHDSHGFGGELSSAMDLAFAANPLSRGESRLARVRELHRLQDDSTAEILNAPESGGIVEADPARVARLVRAWPAWVQPTKSVVCFVQQAPVPGGAPRLVLNVAATGYGRARNRVHEQLRASGATPEDLTAPPPEAGTVTAEFAGAFGSGLNRRRPSAQFELDYPGVVSGRPSSRRLAPSDLMVSLDPDGKLLRLTSTSLGMRVKPLHLGMMADSLLPPAARMLSHVFGGGYLKHPASAMLSSIVDAGVPEDVVHHPRVHLGHVVLRRASWLVPAALVPVRDAGEQLSEYLCHLLGWLRRHEIPAGCYVRALDADLFDDQRNASPYWAFRKSRKPLFVDFANVMLVELFEHLATDPDTVALVVEEALPVPEDAPRDAEGARRVAEFVVEISEEGAADE